jgi:actin-related protein
MSEEIGNTKEKREKTTLIMYESFGILGFFLEQTSLFNLFYSGRTTGTVLNMGDSKNDSCCIIDGKILPKTEISHVGGKDLTQQLQKILYPKGYFGNFFEDQKLFNHMKETKCFVSLNHYNQQLKDMDYETPDGNIITLSNEAYLVPEILFNPSVINNELSIQEIISNCIRSKDEDLWDLMYSNVVLGGDGSLFKGLKERLEFELTSFHTKEIKVFAPKSRHSQCIGASMFSNLSTFQKEWITKEQYEEYGPGIVHFHSFNNVESKHTIRSTRPNQLREGIFKLLKDSNATDIHFQ